MKAVIRRSFRSVAMIAAALLVGLAAVPLFAGADVVDSAKTTTSGESEECALAAKAKAASSCAANGAADKFIAALLGDSEAGAKIAAALAKETSTCGTSTAKADNAGLSAKVNAVVAAEPSTCSTDKTAALTASTDTATCSAHAKVTKVTSAKPSACSASTEDVAAKTEAVDAKIAKVVATTDVPECCQDKTASTEEAGD